VVSFRKDRMDGFATEEDARTDDGPRRLADPDGGSGEGRP